jgi:hypothetical protein
LFTDEGFVCLLQYCYQQHRMMEQRPALLAHLAQVMHSSKVYLKLNERLGLSDHSMVLNIMLR